MRYLPLLLVWTTFVFAESPSAKPSPEPAYPTDKLNKQITNPTVLDSANKETLLFPKEETKGTVVVFLSFECPVSNGYSPTLIEMHKEYSAKGIRFLGVCPNEMDKGELAKKVKEFEIPFAVYADPKLNAVDALKVATTPESFLLDHNGVLRYRGRIDNMYAARLKKNAKVTEFDLKNAIDDLLAGKAVRTPATLAVGCPVNTKTSTATETTKVTYHRDVLPILQKNCQQCHRSGEVGPFALMTYKHAVNWADDIKSYTQSRKMPPWKPSAGIEFHNDRRMSDAEIKTLATWVDNGTPEGDPKDAPAPRKFDDGWQLGKPDLILTADEDYHLGASGNDAFRCFVMPTNLKDDMHIIGYEVRPGNPKIVHHVINYWDISGRARELEKEARTKASADDRDKGPGYSSSMGIGFIPKMSDRPGIPTIGNFGGWAPGQVPRFMPEGTGYLLPKGADVVMQVHYHRNGRPEKDRTQIGIYLAKKPVEKNISTIVVGPKLGVSTLVIPAGKADHIMTGSAYLWVDADLHSVMPHMHLIGRSVKVTMTPKDEKPITLVEIKDWDYNWQETYWMKKPMRVKAGTKFEIEAVFDNSSKNPNNPFSPPAFILFGEQTNNEMLFGFIGATAVEKDKRVRFGTKPPE